MQKIQDKIAQIVSCFVKKFESAEIDYDVSLMELGLDEAASIQVLNIIQEEFDIEIPYEHMQDGNLNAIIKGVKIAMGESE